MHDDCKLRITLCSAWFIQNMLELYGITSFIASMHHVAPHNSTSVTKRFVRMFMFYIFRVCKASHGFVKQSCVIGKAMI